MILNPIDARSPYWSPGDELRHEAEALTLATSLFPDRVNENPFFTEGPRRIFAHLLTFRPTAEELALWLCHDEELDRRVQGTPYASIIDRQAPAQRSGVLAALNMVADTLKLLPRESETNRRWSATSWARDRRGWLFLTSTPETRIRLVPLTSLWLDMLVLRLMNRGQPGHRPVRLILDELASLQRLPQLHTAVTENRKSNNPVVLGFQGRSQLETRYWRRARTSRVPIGNVPNGTRKVTSFVTAAAASPWASKLEIARVENVDTKNNEVTVRTDDERAVSYDPRRLQGVTRYRETERAFAEGDRVQMTAPDRERGVANRELGTVEQIDPNGRMDVRWDSGRTSSFEASEHRHLDYGCAVTRHSSQGQTAARVLVHVEVDRASEKLVNQRLAYVAVSRGQYDAHITPMTRSSFRARWTATCHINRRWRERRYRHRDRARVVRARGVNRAVTRWPSVRHETTCSAASRVPFGGFAALDTASAPCSPGS